MSEPVYEVVWPKSAQGVQSKRSADRLDGLANKRVAFVWDYLFRGDELFPILERELRMREPAIEIVGYETFGNSHGADEADFIARLPDALAEHRIDAVISGMGC
ncbi:MAG: hypothetical protein AAFN30_12855 [Actinomycetota bacterium]